MDTNDDLNTESRVNRGTAAAASTAKSGIDAASAGADRALHAASRKLDDVRDQGAPALKQGIDQAQGLGRSERRSCTGRPPDRTEQNERFDRSGRRFTPATSPSRHS